MRSKRVEMSTAEGTRRRCYRHAAFSVVELMVVIAIILTLAALSFPAFVSARLRAKIEDDKQRLHQCQLACALYQIDSGSSSSLPFGLPSALDAIVEFKAGRTFYGLRSSDMHSACGRHPMSLTPIFQWFLGDAPTGAGAEFLQRHGEQTPLFVDHNCNDPNLDLDAEWVTKRGIAVLANGSLVVRMRPGFIGRHTFWEMK